MIIFFNSLQPTAEQVQYARLLNHDDPEWLTAKIQKVAGSFYHLSSVYSCLFFL